MVAAAGTSFRSLCASPGVADLAETSFVEVRVHVLIPDASCTVDDRLGPLPPYSPRRPIAHNARDGRGGRLGARPRKSDQRPERFGPARGAQQTIGDGCAEQSHGWRAYWRHGVDGSRRMDRRCVEVSAEIAMAEKLMLATSESSMAWCGRICERWRSHLG